MNLHEHKERELFHMNVPLIHSSEELDPLLQLVVDSSQMTWMSRLIWRERERVTLIHPM